MKRMNESVGREVREEVGVWEMAQQQEDNRCWENQI